ncbi:hypothetical protein R9C00_23305 [Flammeovirgaceae bacterium SG7u.111]|nr:hypothetical protein [Flammeovirgaceae bacterium SG7u.132]WPO34634.1 hypothetical protein R9C00_23305 [Flammeovirgaceae bacterium SG7u.111]
MESYCKKTVFQFKKISKTSDSPSSSTGTISTKPNPTGNTGRDYFIKKYVCNLDWFQCTIVGCPFAQEKEEYAKGDFRLVKRFTDTGTTGTPQFGVTYTIFYRKLKFGQLHANPRSDKIMRDETMGMFRAENEELYREGFPMRFLYFLQAWELGFNNYSRIDIALDFPTSHEFLSFIQSIQTRDSPYSLLGRNKLLSIRSHNGKLTGFSLGMSSSNKSITCYDKSGEIREKNHKPYIVETWLGAGLIPNLNQHHMTRLEVRMKRDELIKYGAMVEEEFKVLPPLYLNNLPRFLEMVMKDFFEFGIKSKDTNKSRWERLPVIDFEGVKKPQLLFKRSIKPEKNNLISLKRYLKKNLALFLETGDSDYLYALANTAIGSGQWEFVSEKLEYWHKDITKKLETTEHPPFDLLWKTLARIAKDIQRTQELAKKAKKEYHEPSEKLLGDIEREHSFFFWPSNTGKTKNRYAPGFHRDVEFLDSEQTPF